MTESNNEKWFYAVAIEPHWRRNILWVPSCRLFLFFFLVPRANPVMLNLPYQHKRPFLFPGRFFSKSPLPRSLTLPFFSHLTIFFLSFPLQRCISLPTVIQRILPSFPSFLHCSSSSHPLNSFQHKATSDIEHTTHIHTQLQTVS